MPNTTIYQTIADVRAANKAAGQRWFERKTMRFFQSRIESALYGGRYFITSEQCPGTGHARKYSIREALPTGEVETVGEFQQYRHIEDAREAARKLARGGVK